MRCWPEGLRALTAFMRWRRRGCSREAVFDSAVSVGHRGALSDGSNRCSAAYKYGTPVVAGWFQPAKGPSASPPAKSEQPGNAKPLAGHSAQPQEQPSQAASNPQGSPAPGQAPELAPGQLANSQDSLQRPLPLWRHR